MGGLNSSIMWLVSSLYVWVEAFPHSFEYLCDVGDLRSKEIVRCYNLQGKFTIDNRLSWLQNIFLPSLVGPLLRQLPVLTIRQHQKQVPSDFHPLMKL